MSNESMANLITDVPCAIAELLAVNKQLEQQLSKAQADLELAVEALRKIGDHETLDDDKYTSYEAAWFGVAEFARQTLKQIKEKEE